MNTSNTAENVTLIPTICTTDCKRYDNDNNKCPKGLQPKIGMFGKIYCKRFIPKK